ncbi:carboxylesterase family protein [Consotaella aegiceratis]|uniref:carboxylesterase family protein n=1 Tax=Consotaella aegiceratis TaxID=3097961 RepID=UPI002F3FDBDF
MQSGAFAASGVVEVSVNYRLGALGFLHLDGCPDNRGLLDQIAALEWVQRNIAAFGGDPARVTYAGRSAGGFSIATVMAMPASHGLYAQAMPQSGASTAVATMEEAQKLTARMTAALGTDETGLRCVSIDDLLTAQRDLCNESYEQHDYARDGAAAMVGVPFVPVIDGQSLLEHPEAAAAAGRTASVPMMIGCTSGEYVTHATAHSAMDFAACIGLLHERVRAKGLTGAEIVTRYRATLSDHTPLGIWRAVAGDLVFQLPAIRFAKLHAAHQPVWKYLYGPIVADELGAPHGAEVGAVWYRRGMDLALQPERQRVKDIAFAADVHETWATFVRAAADEHKSLRLRRDLDWPRYCSDDPRVLRMKEGSFSIERDPFDARASLWQR